MEERIGWQEQNKSQIGGEEKRREVEDLLVLPRPAKSMQDGAGFSKET